MTRRPWLLVPFLAAVTACSEIPISFDWPVAPAGSSVTSPLAPASCPAGATPAALVEETPPPSTMTAGATAAVSVTFANCSGSSWEAAASVGAATGFKLGSDGPRDNTTWTGSTRVALPVSVPAGEEVTVSFTVRAPVTAGSYGYSWGVVQEGVAWLPASSPVHSIAVQAAAQVTGICPGVSADLGGLSPASAAVQACVDSTPVGGTLELPPGIYRVNSQIVLARPITLRTRGLAPNAPVCLAAGSSGCAVLRADPDLFVFQGLVRMPAGSSQVHLEHIVIDGNRSARLGSAAATQCVSGSTRYGYNASAGGCTDCSFVLSATLNGLCGSGFEWIGDGARILASTFQGNGDHGSQMMWSDGLTLGHSDGAEVADNQFLDNSDVDLVTGGARGGSIHDNLIQQDLQGAFAGLMLDNFNGTATGDFTGAVVTANTVRCGAELCDFGIELGPHPWYLSGNLIGGTVTGNSVSGAKMGIDAEGAGTDAAPMLVSGNDAGSAPGSAPFNCGSRTTTAFNVSPDSRVDLGSGPAPTASFLFHGCQ